MSEWLWKAPLCKNPRLLLLNVSFLNKTFVWTTYKYYISLQEMVKRSIFFFCMAKTIKKFQNYSQAMIDSQFPPGLEPPPPFLRELPPFWVPRLSEVNLKNYPPSFWESSKLVHAICRNTLKSRSYISHYTK